MNWYKQAQFTNIISLQEATDRKMFGPVYHGTNEQNKEKINQEGFKVFVGERGSDGMSHGYPNDPYGYNTDGVPPPVHHLGYGIYFTTNKTIAKRFNNNTVRGMETYFLDVPRLETINFGATNTMMKWWIQSGYDPELAKTDRVSATMQLTENLKSAFDAVWFKGKSLYKLLDGDQICVYDPAKIYKIDKNLSIPGEIGSKVIRKSDGMRGILLNRSPIPEDVSEKFHNGEKEFLRIKWNRGGTDFNVYPSMVDFI